MKCNLFHCSLLFLFFLPRYYILADKAIDPSMVGPITKETLNGIYKFVPRKLRTDHPQALRAFLKVIILIIYLILMVISCHFKKFFVLIKILLNNFSYEFKSQ